jgi:hypothetical protein
VFEIVWENKRTIAKQKLFISLIHVSLPHSLVNFLISIHLS